MAQHTTETVKGYRIHYFESAEAAQMWLKDTFGDDADFVSYLSKSDIFVWASQICEHFDGQEYAQQEIVQIIKNRDTKTLSKGIFKVLKTVSASSTPDIPTIYLGLPPPNISAMPEDIKYPKNSSGSNPKSRTAYSTISPRFFIASFKYNSL